MLIEHCVENLHFYDAAALKLLAITQIGQHMLHISWNRRFELQPLSAINDIFKRLEHGDVPARVVLDFQTS